MTHQSKRILFVERNLRNEKLGVMYLSASLKAAGHHADLIQTDKEDLDERIRDYKPDFVAFSITTGEHVYALKVARYLKTRYSIPNIFGGPHCTFFPEIGFEAGVDFIVQGQGERAIVMVVDGRAAPGFVKEPMVDHLDDLPFPDRDIFYQYPEFRDNPMKNVITSRACPYKCSYCFNHSQMALTRIDGETKQWFDRRSIENVVAEIDGIRERYPLEKILYLDDSFIQSRDWLDQFLTGYTEAVRLPWMCSLRVNCLDKPLAERMATSGLEMVNYAMESADPDVQQRLLHRGHISNGDVIRAISLFDRFGVRARMQNMIGLPLSNTLEDALNTLQFNMRHRVTDSWCSIFQPYPRTALGQYCVDHDYATTDQLRHCSESFFDESRLSISNRDELYGLQKLWYFIIDGQLPLELTRLLIRGKFSEEIGDQLQRLRFKCSRKKLYGIDDAEADLAIDLQSRERWAFRPQTNGRHQKSAQSSQDAPRRTNGTHRQRATDQQSAQSLVRAALADTSLPDRFIEIMSGVSYEESDVHALGNYVRGELTAEQPLYTIDDETGELADPAVSIYMRGTSDPDGSDIRNMPESHFMDKMSETRDLLKSGATACKSSSSPVFVQIGPPDSEGDSDLLERVAAPIAASASVRRPASDRDERHLNQYLA